MSVTLIMLVPLIIAFVYHFAEAAAFDDGTSIVNKCDLYLAPSLTPGIGRGVFAGTSYTSGDIIENSVTLSVSSAYSSSWQLNNYLWATDETSVSMAEFGLGMLYNHKNPALLSHQWPSHFKMSTEQELAHTTYTTLPSAAVRDIIAGEELFVSYSEGNTWLEQRGIFITDVPDNETYIPPVRSAEELQRVGICMTDVEVKKSRIPLAGKGLFAVKDFKMGDILTVSPTMILPKDQVSNVGIEHKDIIQNYCIASSNVSNIVFFPFALGAMANHASAAKGTANMKLEWYWWNQEEKEMKMRTSAADLKSAEFAQLDIAYIALRDIYAGEELTYDYGDDWAQSWTNHLASLNQWYINTAARDEYENDHKIVPNELGASEKPKFLYFIASEDLFLPIWKAESANLIAETEKIAAEALVASEAAEIHSENENEVLQIDVSNNQKVTSDTIREKSVTVMLETGSRFNVSAIDVVEKSPPTVETSFQISIGASSMVA